MKTIQIITKRKADALLIESLFRQGGTYRKERYDMGKYKPESSFVGREIECSDDVICVWAESRRDQDGPYKALFCLTLPN